MSEQLYASRAQKQRLIAWMDITRIRRPVGIWLLLWPCWWGVGLASTSLPDPYLLFLFAIGAACMRSAGCIVNDMADRKFDAKVERTKMRPLACGAMSMKEASLLLATLLLISLLVVLQLPHQLLYYAAASLLLVAAYPFMKRITFWPQAFLGITFNLGALFGWIAVQGEMAWPAIWLYLAGICWTIGYDTIYAHQDIEDDLKIGVKSTAIRFGQHNRQWISGFYAACVLFLALAVFSAGAQGSVWLAPLLAAAHFIWQVRLFEPHQGTKSLMLFKSNGLLGLLIALCLLADAAFTG